MIEPAGGVVDKFLGDAIFAYWKQDALAPMRVGESLKKLAEMQAARDPDFRLVLHFGPAVMAGGAGGADNLSGPEVISVFRMEKVCSGLGNDSIVSESARAPPAAHLRDRARRKPPSRRVSGHPRHAPAGADLLTSWMASIAVVMTVFFPSSYMISRPPPQNRCSGLIIFDWP